MAEAVRAALAAASASNAGETCPRRRARLSTRRCAAAALFAAIAFFCVPQAARAAAADTRTAPYIEVTGEAEVEVPADLAMLDFGVVTRADTAAAAARENSVRMEAVLAAVRKTLGPKARISTGTYNLRPDYTAPRDGGAPRVTGYTATNVAQLKTGELARLGEVIDSAIQAGANQVQRIAFTLSEPAAPRRQALRDAVSKARDKAEAIAGALGLAVSAVHSVVEQDLGQPRPLMREAMMARAESAPVTPVEPGLIQVRARVVLTMQIAR